MANVNGGSWSLQPGGLSLVSADGCPGGVKGLKLPILDWQNARPAGFEPALETQSDSNGATEVNTIRVRRLNHSAKVAASKLLAVRVYISLSPNIYYSGRHFVCTFVCTYVWS